MLTFPFVNMPQRFAHILQDNMQTSGGNFSKLRDTIYQDHGLRAVVLMAFEEMGKDMQLGSVIKSIGWHGFRNKLASMYLTYAEEGAYLTEPHEDLLESTLEFEKSLKDYIVAGYSRAFLLGFYCQFARMGKTSTGEEVEIEFDHELINLLEFTNARLIEVDWMLIMLYHFREFLGQKHLLQQLRKGVSFNSLYDELSEEQKAEMVGNFLSYGASIDDPDMFSMDRV